MQVGHVDAGADEVLGLFDQAGALGSAHGNAVVLAPLLGGGSDHHVSGAAFEHAGLEDVEDVGDSVEHGELAVPLGEGARGLDTGLAFAQAEDAPLVKRPEAMASRRRARADLPWSMAISKRV